jgi:hypothetical protein
MEIKDILRKLEGIQTISSVMDILKIDKNKAIKYVSHLRKEGYVKTKRLKNKTRVYNISFENKLKGRTYEEIINENSPIKISPLKKYYIYRKKVTFEEVLIYSIKTGSLRTILATLNLFKKIDDWKLLYKLSKKNHLERQVGALYDLSRKIMKTRRISRNFIRNSLPKDNPKYRYVIKNLKSKDFKDIEKKWRVYLPFNKEDLTDYKR